ncbi:hypothetical protein [Gorillibacterium sp. sgz500922]|uniref:hypothetical protein n=1 Tax=Gorillibacterium sp. sgz500922 TaxID=3446694 RepID=UPI003F673D1F
MRELSDKLFMLSLFLLIVAFLVAGFGPNQAIKGDSEDQDEEPRTRFEKKLEKQDKRLKAVWRSKLLWIAVAGMVLSVIVSFL